MCVDSSLPAAQLHNTKPGNLKHLYIKSEDSETEKGLQKEEARSQQQE